VTLQAGKTYGAKVQVTDPDSDPLVFAWDIRPEVEIPAGSYAGSMEKKAEPIAGLIRDPHAARSNSPLRRPPARTGCSSPPWTARGTSPTGTFHSWSRRNDSQTQLEDPQFIRLTLLASDRRFASYPFLVRGSHNIILVRWNRLVSAEAPKDRCSWQPRDFDWTTHERPVFPLNRPCFHATESVHASYRCQNQSLCFVRAPGRSFAFAGDA
jgi:hypothetical protein